MTYPTIHLNGTSAKGLQEPLITAADHLTLALKALAEARPHGRDYYTRSGALAKATGEYLAREGIIHAILDEIRDISANIEEQELARRR